MDPVVLCNKCQHEFIPDAEIKHIPIITEEMVRTNQLPTLAESQQVLLDLEQENRALERCDQEIGRLEKAMEQLKARKAVLARRIECRSSWVSPIRRLPNEILYKIFAMVCRGKYGYGLDTAALKLFFAPILFLTHVSYHWRWVASTSAKLWSSMHIWRHPSALALLRHYLTMSKESPLDIKFWHSVKGAFGMLMPHLTRIERLELQHDHTVFDEVTVSQTPSFASLRFLECNHLELNRFPGWFSDALRTAPNLTGLSLYQCHVPDAKDLPYHQLTCLEVHPRPRDYDSWKSLITTLRHCRRLQVLRIHSLYHAEVDLHVELPTLLHLSVSRGGLGFGLDVFTLPSLTTIHAREVQSLEPFTRLIHRSGCSLVKFRFAHSPVHHSSSTEIHEFLSKCPQLTELKFCDIQKDADQAGMFTDRLFGAYGQQEVITEIATELAQGESSIASDSAPLSSRGLIIPNLMFIRVQEYSYTATSQELLDLLRKIESWNKSRIRHPGAGGLSKPQHALVTVNESRRSARCWPTQEMKDAHGIRARIKALKEDGIRCEFKIMRSSQ